jgi:hypothetical protein
MEGGWRKEAERRLRTVAATGVKTLTFWRGRERRQLAATDGKITEKSGSGEVVFTLREGRL